MRRKHTTHPIAHLGFACADGAGHIASLRAHSGGPSREELSCLEGGAHDSQFRRVGWHPEVYIERRARVPGVSSKRRDQYRGRVVGRGIMSLKPIG